MATINGILYFRRQAISWKYPELLYGEGKDYFIANMDRNPSSPTYGQDKIFDWYTTKYPKPTDAELLQWYQDFKYLEKRRYDTVGEQLDRLWHDIENGTLDKNGEFYLGNKAVKDASPKGV